MLNGYGVTDSIDRQNDKFIMLKNYTNGKRSLPKANNQLH